MEKIIIEASIDRHYKCPYCNYKDTRENLVSHINDEHEELIPKNYTAARTLFNHLNKKDHGSCIMCSKETKWNENNWRYDRLCTRPTCEIKYVQMFRDRMKKAGKENQMNDPEHQKKMLKNRSISGEYKFKDSGIKGYTGSYEKKLLEFYDKVLNVHSRDIITPGPTIGYTYEGKKLFWITDIFYVPFNLVIDVKDGGDNPNNREMESYREKQVAKEKAIEQGKQYNYLRLTNNNFEQLLLIMAEIKHKMMDNITDPIVRINEDMGMMMGALPNQNYSNDVYIIPYLKKGNFNVQYGITRDPSLNRVLGINDNGDIETINSEYMREYVDKYSIYKYKGENGMEKYKSILLEPNKSNKNNNKTCFYEELTGRKLLSEDQVEFDDDFEEMEDIFGALNSISECIIESVKNDKMMLPVIDKKSSKLISEITCVHSNINIYRDSDGYFAKNLYNENRTKSYDDIRSIPIESLSFINKI